ncbi:MAG: hypothetical protein EOO44_06340 [Flavobacterium sp.]|nr:MAG: hypothetical protein EOO44_06340 [Flavobacterium sp.]
MKKQNIENIFSSMENFSSVPPPELWSEIEKKLDKPKKKKRAILWWSAAACLLLGLMLPTVQYFNSGSGIKNGNNSSTNNTIVLDENKTNQNRSIPADGTTVDQKSLLEKDQITGSKENNQPETAVAHTDVKDKPNNKVSAEELSADSKNTNEAVAEKSSVSGNQNTFNSSSKNKLFNSERRNTNQAVAEKSVISGNQNTFNSVSKNQTFNSEKRNTNQALAEKSVISGNQNTFNSVSKNQTFNSEKRNTNQALAEKSAISGNQNTFNSASKNQIFNSEKGNTNQAIAEKTLNSGKQNPFNAASKNQVSNPFSEEKPNSYNNKNLALNTTDPALSSELNNKAKKDNNTFKNEPVNTENAIADNQKTNSKFIDVLSKQDSVQLAELQNLEKGIKNPEDKKEKETKPKSNAEKWAVQVFAGVANSENYKNEKTLGHVNDSKQTSTYGVKTKYKINKKWAVGSGFKINELGQSIANVSYMDVSAKNSVFFSSSEFFVKTATTPQIANNRGYVFVSNSTKEALVNENVQTGNLDQSLRYIEMPLEVSYSVFNKNRTNISLNTGGFVGKLISNNVALDGNSIGENLDANDFVYGSVLSSTVQYRIYKKTNLFVEPAMNYYINPLNNQSFNQLQWGLNFGLNVSF